MMIATTLDQNVLAKNDVEVCAPVCDEATAETKEMEKGRRPVKLSLVRTVIKEVLMA